MQLRASQLRLPELPTTATQQHHPPAAICSAQPETAHPACPASLLELPNSAVRAPAADLQLGRFAPKLVHSNSNSSNSSHSPEASTLQQQRPPSCGSAAADRVVADSVRFSQHGLLDNGLIDSSLADVVQGWRTGAWASMLCRLAAGLLDLGLWQSCWYCSPSSSFQQLTEHVCTGVTAGTTRQNSWDLHLDLSAADVRELLESFTA